MYFLWHSFQAINGGLHYRLPAMVFLLRRPLYQTPKPGTHPPLVKGGPSLSGPVFPPPRAALGKALGGVSLRDELWEGSGKLLAPIPPATDGLGPWLRCSFPPASAVWRADPTLSPTDQGMGIGEASRQLPHPTPTGGTSGRSCSLVVRSRGPCPGRSPRGGAVLAG